MNRLTSRNRAGVVVLIAWLTFGLQNFASYITDRCADCYASSAVRVTDRCADCY